MGDPLTNNAQTSSTVDILFRKSLSPYKSAMSHFYHVISQGLFQKFTNTPVPNSEAGYQQRIKKTFNIVISRMISI